MTREWEALEAALVCLRDPLSRIQLATSELEGAAANDVPATRSIQQAVSEIDLRLEDALTSLRRRSTLSEPAADLRQTVRRVVDDLERALAARGIELLLGALPDEPVPGDDSLVRRTLCRLLLGVSRWMHTQPGAVELRLVSDAVGAGVELCAQLHGPGLRGASRDILGPIRGFALSEDLALEAQIDAAAGRAKVLASFGRRFAS
jgi:light-regulated signal transduction histidine kinase (bacteriophytochrome)